MKKINWQRLNKEISDYYERYKEGLITLSEFSSEVSLITKVAYEGRFEVRGLVVGSSCSVDPTITPKSLLQDRIDYLAKELFKDNI